MSEMSTVLAIACGAAVGGVGRAVLEKWITSKEQVTGFPWALFVINTLGSAIAGASLAATTGWLRIFLIIGLAGSLTTFSGWIHMLTYRYRELASAGNPKIRVTFYLAGVIVLSIVSAAVAAYLGFHAFQA